MQKSMNPAAHTAAAGEMSSTSRIIFPEKYPPTIV